MSLFRVALCFSGQARTWRSNVESIKRFFSNQKHPFPNNKIKQSVQYDCFIHTWDVNNFRASTYDWDINLVPLPSEDPADMQDACNPIYMEVESYDAYCASTDRVLNWDPMFYSFMKSIHFKRNYELEKNFEYDLVVKVRLDTIWDIDQTFILHKAEPMVAYSCSPVGKFIIEFHYNNFDDVLFYGDSKTMDLIANTYRLHKQARSKEYKGEFKYNTNPELFFGPGCLLYKTLIDMSIHPTCTHAYKWYVIRKHVADLGLDFVKDWKTVKEMSDNWYKNV
jgi:hypothetical protein